MKNNTHLKIFENIETKTKVHLVAIGILIVLLCITNVAYIVPGSLVYVLIVFYTAWASNRRKGEISSYIEELTVSVDSAAKNTLINSPFPILVLETDGNIIWKSTKFNKEFGNIGINTYIDNIAREIKTELEENQKPRFEKTVEIEDKTYEIIGNGVRVKQKDKRKPAKYMTILYFLDVTEKQEIYEKYNDSRTCMGIVMIDNYEETLRKNFSRR